MAVITSYTDSVPATLEPGDYFAGYLIVRPLGAGGMGAVFQARHPELKKSFAIKILPESLTDDPSFPARFRREMETVSQLDHPNIVTATDGGTVDGQIWFAMTYVAGRDAQRALHDRGGGLAPEQAVAITEKVAAALDHAHRHGVLHRDIKPANILLAQSESGDADRVYLTDFGIAKAIDDVRQITTTPQGPMTLDFASPEQIRGEGLDDRTDVYSLGATMFTLLTGSVPFPAPSFPAKMLKHLAEPPPRPSQFDARIPRGFDDVVSRAMAKNPWERYRTCGELARAARAAIVVASPSGDHPGRSARTPWPPPTATAAPPLPPRQTGQSNPTPPLDPTPQTDRVTAQWAGSTGGAPPPGRTRIAPEKGRHPRRSALLVTALVGVLAVLGAGAWWWSTTDSTAAGEPATSSAAVPASQSSQSVPASPASVSPAGDGAAEGSAPDGPVALSALLTPAPEQLQGTVAGSRVSEPGYRLMPKNCPPGNQTLSLDLGAGYDSVDGQLQLDDDTPTDVVVEVTAAADGTVVAQEELTPGAGASFDVAVSGVQNLVFTLETAGQAACDSDDYLVFLTAAIAHPHRT